MKLIFGLLLFINSIILYSQPYNKKLLTPKHNTIYVSFLPADMGVGIRYDINWVYGSISYGNYWLEGNAYIKNHSKLSTGLLYPLPPDLFSDFRVWVTGGINYHLWSNANNGYLDLNPIIWKHWSYELGVITKWPRFSIALVTDIRRWEPSISFGYNFNFKRNQKVK
jgi:hypothetical protein